MAAHPTTADLQADSQADSHVDSHGFSQADPLLPAVNLRLAMLGLPKVAAVEDVADNLVAPLLDRQRELSRRLDDRLPPVDERVEEFLAAFLHGVEPLPRLPRRTLALDLPGLARTLSLPADSDEYSSDLITSYRLANGVLHNPRSDRRTTAGVFHLAEGGLPIPDDKKAVPREVFAALLALAFEPPADALELPITSTQEDRAACFVSLLLRPLVVVGVPGRSRERRLETRFIVPGSMVANLDFVEGIFGNAGDPYLPENDSALDPLGWTGHTGLVVLAPHLTSATKQSLGLPHRDDATERQRRDGMCWTDPAELYNDGQAFKVCARDERGVMVTLIADNYFGYCKKEVKTQISMSANLLGGAEEEHSGGAMVFPSWDEGQEFTNRYAVDAAPVADVVARDPQDWDLAPSGWARSTSDRGLVLVPADAHFSLDTRSVTWEHDGTRVDIPFRGDTTYLDPTGFRVAMHQVRTDPVQWTIVGTSATAMVCHKPCTVSGGGKSEISKSIADAITIGEAYVSDFEADMDAVERIVSRDYSGRFADPARNGTDARPVLGAERSIGSVIKLFTPRKDYSEEHNDFVRSIPAHILELVYVIKVAYEPEWGDDWRSHFSVSRVNGRPGNKLRLDGRPVLVDMLRVGYETDGSYRLFSLRPDFAPAVKVQTEDDITASVVVPGRDGGPSRKLVENCEGLLFQRPDDAVIPGYDTMAESDIASPGTFLSNWQPLDHDAAREITEDAISLSRFTEPMRDLLTGFVAEEGGQPAYVVCSARPRIVDGKPSKNPRYLQVRPDLADPVATATAQAARRIGLGLSVREPLPFEVDVIAAGRRNNPPGEGVPALCAFSPLHYLELPELLMEFISSMTGKSPSTTGAGSEGALTKAPFNALPTTYDLNAAFLSYALTGYDGWLSGAGNVGPDVRVDHDVSLLIPEIFARMQPHERSAAWMIEHKYLERVEDLEVPAGPGADDGTRVVAASRLGHRITEKFASTFLGRIFMHPDSIFTEAMLRPETQDLGVFVDSVDVMVSTHERVARAYLKDGTIESACPPVRALLEIMADGISADGLTLGDPRFREMFTRESVLASDWYAARLDAAQAQLVARADAGIAALEQLVGSGGGSDSVAQRLGLADRLAEVTAAREAAASPDARRALVGTIGRQDTLR
jgi:phosphoenolpyruvate carboxykinase (diphosphate)